MNWRLLRGPSGESNRLLTVTSFPLSAGRASGEFVAVDAVAATDTISQRRVTLKVAGLGGSADLMSEYHFLMREARRGTAASL